MLIFQLWHNRETGGGGRLSTTDVMIELLDVLPFDVLPIILCKKFNKLESMQNYTLSRKKIVLIILEGLGT